MQTITNISVREDVALITLRNCPVNMTFIAKVFKMISDSDVNVDMITQSAPLEGSTSVSFSINGNDMGKVLELFAVLRNEYPELKSDISAGNCKISVFGEAMRDIPGVAAKTFDIISKLNVDLRLITTSEVDISVLIPKADFDTTHEALVKAYSL